tara:strand:+ start:1463 stop:1777 length:315 start_codon:yes stop_codon:yes gene_type:complete
MPTNRISVSTQLQAKNSVTVVERGSISGIAAASDKTKNISINVNAWTTVGNLHEILLVHNLAKKPAVTIVDSFNQVVYSEVIYVDNSTVKLIVTAQFSGTAHFN